MPTIDSPSIVLASTDHHPLLSEQLRPTCLDDLILPDRLLEQLRAKLRSGSIPNLMFYGEPGTGKTSAARILIDGIGADCFELNGSFNHGDKTMVAQIKTFASSMSLFSRPKVCFIDEADYLSKEVQASLRNVVEEVSQTTRFILTANERNRLTRAMQSRFINVCFDVKPSDAPDVMRRIIPRYERKLIALGYNPDPEIIREVVQDHFPDFRAIAGQLEFELE